MRYRVQDDVPRRRISWAITEACDARPVCRYCIAKVTEQTQDDHVDQDLVAACVDGLIRFSPSWVYINGGEPFSVHDFNPKVAHQLRDSGNGVFVTSNFLSPLDAYVEFLSHPAHERTVLNLSYHPHLFETASSFLGKLQTLLKRTPTDSDVRVSAVLQPHRLEELHEFDQELRDTTGIDLYPQSLKVHAGEALRRPFSYSDEQRELLQRFRTKTRKSFPVPTAGIRCWAGNRYLFIDARGSVYRCQMYFESPSGDPIGQIHDPEFALSEEPLPCGFDHCGCGSAQESGALEREPTEAWNESA